MQTVVVLESSTGDAMQQLLNSLPYLVVPVDKPAKARQLLMNLPTNLFICDLGTPNLNYKELVSASTVGNPDIKILLTGNSSVQPLAADIIKSEQGHQFLAKPWHPLQFKQVVNSLIHEEGTRHFPIRRTGKESSKPLLKKYNTTTNRRIVIHSSHAQKTQQKDCIDATERGRYRIDKIIGEGGSGRVCKAYDTILDMPVAIKFLNPDLVRDENAIQALKAETRICLQLQHKHIVRIYNLERHGPSYMLIMEYIEGDSIFQMMQCYPNGMPPDFVSQVVRVTTGALAYAHRHGVLHKDITPGNILITKDGLLKVIDFGIASKTNIEQNPDSIAGTPEYMSPEHIRGELLDARSDIYALGVLVTQMLTGHTVNASGATIRDMAYEPHPPIGGLPEPVTQILETATAFSPADRWSSMTEFGEAFEGACAMSFPVAQT